MVSGAWSRMRPTPGFYQFPSTPSIARCPFGWVCSGDFDGGQKMGFPIEKQAVFLQGKDGQYLQACMMFPGPDNAVELRPVKAGLTVLALRFCSIANAEKFADLLNTHSGAGYWVRVLA